MQITKRCTLLVASVLGISLFGLFSPGFASQRRADVAPAGVAMKADITRELTGLGGNAEQWLYPGADVMQFASSLAAEDTKLVRSVLLLRTADSYAVVFDYYVQLARDVGSDDLQVNDNDSHGSLTWGANSISVTDDAGVVEIVISSARVR